MSPPLKVKLFFNLIFMVLQHGEMLNVYFLSFSLLYLQTMLPYHRAYKYFACYVILLLKILLLVSNLLMPTFVFLCYCNSLFI